MVKERPAQFSGTQRFGAAPRPGFVRPSSSTAASGSSASATPKLSRAQMLGIGLARGGPGGGGSGGGPRGGVGGSGGPTRGGLGPAGARGLGLGRGGLKRHVKVQRDTIFGITKGDIRRLARRGGIKRISGNVYNDIRQALKERLQQIMKDVIAVVEYSGRKTITVTDLIFVLNRQGRTLYGFDPSFIGNRH